MNEDPKMTAHRGEGEAGRPDVASARTVAVSLLLEPRTVTVFLSAVVLFLTGAHLLGLVFRYGLDHDHVYGLVPLFNLNIEQNVPTLYSTLTLFLCGVLSVSIAQATLRSGGRFVWQWRGLGFLFLFLALDEFASIHERLEGPMKSLVGTGGFLTNAWVFPYVVAGAVLLVLGVPFLLGLPGRTRNVLVLSGLVFVSGAAGLEVLAGPDKEAAAGVSNLTLACWATAEEFLEMAGVVVCINALTTHLADELGGVALSVLRGR